MTNEERDIITQFIARVERRAGARAAVVRRLGAGDHDAGPAAGRSRGRPADRRHVHPLSRGALPDHPACLRAGARAGRGAEPHPAAGVGAAAGASRRCSRPSNSAAAPRAAVSSAACSAAAHGRRHRRRRAARDRPGTRAPQQPAMPPITSRPPRRHNTPRATSPACSSAPAPGFLGLGADHRGGRRRRVWSPAMR